MRTPNPNPPSRKEWIHSEEGIKGVVVKELRRNEDERGWLIELFRSDELPILLGFSPKPCMAYMSCTAPDVQRGPHEHMNQTDVFVFISGTFIIELWDNRPESPTYKQWMHLCFDKSMPGLVVVPPGVVHGYKNIDSEPGLVFNAPNALFKGYERKEEVDEIRHELNPKSPFNVNLSNF